MKQITKENLIELVEKTYKKCLDEIKQYEKDLNDNMELIKKLEEIGIYNKFAYNRVDQMAGTIIACNNHKLYPYEIDTSLMHELYEKGYNDKLVESEVDRALRIINRLYSIDKNKIETKSSGLISTISEGKVYRFKAIEIISRASDIFDLKIDKEKLNDFEFEIGLNIIDGNYVVKIFKNGKLQLIKK